MLQEGAEGASEPLPDRRHAVPLHDLALQHWLDVPDEVKGRIDVAADPLDRDQRLEQEDDIARTTHAPFAQHLEDAQEQRPQPKILQRPVAPRALAWSTLSRTASQTSGSCCTWIRAKVRGRPVSRHTSVIQSISDR